MKLLTGLVSLTLIAAAGAQDRYDSHTRESMDRVRSDLDRVARALNYLSDDNYRRFSGARSRLGEFQGKWERGRFDREDLRSALDDLRDLLDSSQLRDRERQTLADDVRLLRDIERDGGGREERGSRAADDPRSRNEALNESYAAGVRALQARDYNRAVAEFRRTVQIDPSQVAAWMKLGEAHTLSQDYREAERAFRKAVDLQPANAEFRNQHAIAMGRTGDIDGAMSELEEAARIDPANGDKYFFNLGAILINSGQKEGAGRAFRRSVRINPSYAEAHYQYGAWLMSESKFADARDEFIAYLRLTPYGPNAQAARNNLDAMDRR